MKWRLGRLVLCGALAALAALGTGGALAQDRPGTVIRDPYYGDALFHFFQDAHFDALAGLMVSQHFGRLPAHADEAEVLRGGLLLSYGLQREAGAVFAALVDRQTAPAVRDRAWYFLARMRYQRGRHAEALQALDRIGDALPAELAEDHALLRANVLMAAGRHAAAAAWLAGLPPRAAETVGSRYARFNLGVAWIKAGETARGSALLDALGRAPARLDEEWALRDKANVALGFAALADGQPEAARAALERVRLEGPSSTQALLGLGWAASALAQPKRALAPWLELGRRPADDAAVLEARIAIPFAHAELGALGASLQGYEEALAGFEREAAQLDETIAAVRSGALVRTLLQDMGAGRPRRLDDADRLPAMPHAGHLTELLASHAFQEGFRSLRDLHALERHLQAWAGRMDVYADMLATRREAYAARLPQVLERARVISLPALQRQRDAAAADLQQAAQEADGRALADARQRALAERLAQVQAALAARADDPTLDAARQRARLAAGALTWQLAQDHPQRRWQATKQLAAIDRQLDAARAREASLQRAQRDEPARFEAFAARLDALERRLNDLQPQVARLAREQQAALQEMTIARLERQKERLAAYAAQARLAVAQLHDRALVARQGREGADARAR